MSPIGVGISNSTYTLRTGEAKLWILLVGINQYQDKSLPSLRYPAVDCKGLGDAMTQAIQSFPNKEVIVHNDFTKQPPTLDIVRESLKKIVYQAQPHDSVMLYFSGHGMLDSDTQQPVLCMTDTHKSDLLNTGLGMQELLQMLGNTLAHQQLLCLDTCHSGNMMLMGGNRGIARDLGNSEALLNSTPKFMDLLRQRAAKSKGFCALLSCDRGQQSWEFPELGHGVFTYYLMQGLLGEAADYQGIIEADGLYKYVYRHTLQYINKLNQQLRLINEHKLRRGDSELYPEYPLQTPKRIVEGVGELVLGFKSESVQSQKQRQAFAVDGFRNTKTTFELARLLSGSGGFKVQYFPNKNESSSQLRASIQEFIRYQAKTQSKSQSKSNSGFSTIKDCPTKLLYLRGKIEEVEDREAWLVLNSGVRLSRSWLRQELRRSGICKQIIILDCPEATNLGDWVEDLQLNSEQAQCLIAAASPVEKPELFSQIILGTLARSEPSIGLSVAEWITQLQKISQKNGINIYTWLSGTRGVIDILPGNISKIFQNLQQPNTQNTQYSLINSTTHSDPGYTQAPTYLNNTKDYGNTTRSSEDNCGKPQTTPKTQLSIPENHKSLPNSTNYFTLDYKNYTQLENLLKQFIGPIAVTVLEDVLPQSRSFQELVELLASFILPEKKAQFKQLAIAILQNSNLQNSNSKAPNLYEVISQAQNQNKSLVLGANFINECKNNLAYLVGPFASFIIQNILADNPQISSLEFITKIAEIIPEPMQAVEFKIKMLEKLK